MVDFQKIKCILLNNFYVCGASLMKLIRHLGALKKWYTHGQLVHIFCIQESGQRAHNSWIKIIPYRFYDTMLPCPTLVLSDKDKFKIFQHFMYFSSDRYFYIIHCRAVHPAKKKKKKKKKIIVIIIEVFKYLEVQICINKCMQESGKTV